MIRSRPSEIPEDKLTLQSVCPAEWLPSKMSIPCCKRGQGRALRALTRLGERGAPRRRIFGQLESGYLHGALQSLTARIVSFRRFVLPLYTPLFACQSNFHLVFPGFRFDVIARPPGRFCYRFLSLRPSSVAHCWVISEETDRVVLLLTTTLYDSSCLSKQLPTCLPPLPFQ